MNRVPADDFDEDDAMLYDALGPLREITPPERLQGKCAEVLSNSQTLSPNLNRYAGRRSLLRSALTMAATMLIGTAIGWTLRGSANGIVDDRPVSDRSEPFDTIMPVAVFPSAAVASSSVMINSEAGDEPSYYAEEFYLCGVGTVYSSSRYHYSMDSK